MADARTMPWQSALPERAADLLRLNTERRERRRKSKAAKSQQARREARRKADHETWLAIMRGER